MNMTASIKHQESLDMESSVLDLEKLESFLSTRQPRLLVDPTLTPASVLLLLYPDIDEMCVLLTKRTSKVEHHKGEISFPGGAWDPDDAGSKETALRETYEELGVVPDDVRILGELDGVATRTNFAISTFVGSISYPYRFVPSKIEVAELLKVPLTTLRKSQEANRAYFLVSTHSDQQYTYTYKRHTIFGATARILNQFLEILDTAEI